MLGHKITGVVVAGADGTLGPLSGGGSPLWHGQIPKAFGTGLDDGAIPIRGLLI